MPNWRRLFSGVRALLRASHAERDLAREVASHLALIEEDYRRRGLSPQDARLAARRAFGGVEQAKEAHRDARSFIWLEQLRQDVRHACRSLARTPGFTIVVVLTLAVGIGANAAIFSVINGVLLKPLPYPDADRLVRLVEHVPASETRNNMPAVRAYFTLADFDALARHTRTLSAAATYGGRFLTMVGPKGAVQVEGAAATPALFGLIGAHPVLGRLFTADDIAAGRDRVVLISYRLWQRQFDSDPHVLGKSIGLQALLGRSNAPESYTVIGVMSPGFRFPEPDTPSQLWTPLSGKASFIMGRLAPGVRLATAQAEISTRLSAERHLPASGDDHQVRFELLSAQRNLVAPVMPALIVLAVAAGFVLLIACVNVANLLLARTMARQHEIAVRVALGAGRGRVIRHLLTESMLLAGLGGLLGVGVAFGGVALLRDLATTLTRIDLVEYLPFPRLNEIAIDGAALAFTTALALATGIIFGLAAAVRSSAPGQLTSLRTGRGSGRSGISALRWLRARGVLVVVETALAMMLLVAGGLLMASFAKLADVDPGYNPEHVLTFQVALAGFSDQRLQRFAEGLTGKLRTIPGVRAAAFVRTLPMASLQDTNRVGSAPASPAETGPIPADQGADIRPVSAGYFAALGMRMMAGRALDDNDGPGHPRVLIINQALARRDFPMRIRLATWSTSATSPRPGPSWEWRRTCTSLRSTERRNRTSSSMLAGLVRSDFHRFRWGRISLHEQPTTRSG
ncbi:MAG TPA: ABC transporter permease [Vicinamibacterales bacterium]